MRNITLFMNVSLDGYFEGPDHDISWTIRDDEAFSSADNDGTGTMLFGHRTYDMMKAYWPTPQAAQNMPEIARYMNENLKVVASHKPFEPGWQNVRVISHGLRQEIEQLKQQPGKDIIIFGSNTLCVSLLQWSLLDEVQLLVNPVVLGRGTSLFQGLPEKANLKLTKTKQHKSGNLLLTYQLVKN